MRRSLPLFCHKALRYSTLATAVFLANPLSAQQYAEIYNGVITDLQGAPLKNVRVHVHGRQQYVYTDEQGRFSIQAPADSELHIIANGYTDNFITANSSQPLVVQLTPGAIERVTVSASGMHQNNLEMATPVSVLTGEELSKRAEPTIGETLKYEPGVHANYYGPVASSPIIRGLDGPRVKMLNNGLDTADVSRVGPDHAVTADAITAQQIEVLRGPATLLYGSGAIGGVVNVVDNRLPRQLRPESETKLESRFVDVSDEKIIALNHEGSSNSVAWHLDGFNRDTSDYEVPEFTNDEGETVNTLANSWTKNKAIHGGVSYIGERGLLGVSVSRLESDYGIPGHHHDEHADTPDQQDTDDSVFASMKQNRVTLAGEWYHPLQSIETLSLTTAYTDYQHQEIEHSEPGTTFKNKALESRLTLEHSALDGWHGVLGYHVNKSDYQAFGEEAFTPDSDSLSQAVFVLEEKQFGQLNAQLGARVEHVKHDVSASAENHATTNVSDSFTAMSASAGLVWEFVPGFSWAFAFSHSERAPSAAELYANGAHMATSSYELGLGYQLENGELVPNSRDIKKEAANNIDITFRSFNGDLSFTYNFFYNKINNYLYLTNTGLTMADLAIQTGEEHNDFPLYQYQQQDATLYGLEFEARYQLDNANALSIFIDTVRAKLDNAGYLPRIPPYKAGLNYQYSGLNWSADFGVTRYAKQDKIAAYESPTAAYTLVDASLNYDFSLAQLDMTAFVRGTNLTDELAFVHSSFIKQDAPLPGRAITLGLRATF